MAKTNTIDLVASILVIIGALNWGLVGAVKIDLVNLLLSSIPILQQIVYIIIGIAGLWVIYTMFIAKPAK